MDLSQMDERDLRRELERRQAERERVAAEALKRHHDQVVQHIDALLALEPNHGRTSCSDTNANNTYRCDRCLLLEIKAVGFVPDNITTISLDIRRRED